MSAEFAPKKVANLLRELFGRAVKVDTADLLTMSPDTTNWVAVYGGNTGKTTGVCVCDLAFAANAAAALCLIPPATAKESISSRKLDPLLAENLREIMNVCSQLFVASESGRITLQSVTSAAQCNSEEAKKMASAPSQKCGMKLSIEGYGDRMVALLTQCGNNCLILQSLTRASRTLRPPWTRRTDAGSTPARADSRA